MVDFAHADEATWQHTAEAVKGLDVGLLINNVGLSYDHPEYFDKLSSETFRDIVEVNITSINQVSQGWCRLHIKPQSQPQLGEKVISSVIDSKTVLHITQISSSHSAADDKHCTAGNER